MTHSPFLLASAVAIVYILFRFIEMRYVMKENKPLKILFRDTLLVYISALIGNFVLNQIVPLQNIMSGDPKVFTNDPDF